MTRIVTTIALLLALSVPSAALAQDPVGDAYGGAGPTTVDGLAGGGVQSGTAGGEGAAGTPTTATQTESGAGTPSSGDDAGGSLPFTGADVGLVAGGGLLLLLLGAGMRRLTHPATR